MRRIGDILKEMGFNKDAPIETQKAFIRHLIKDAQQVQNLNPVIDKDQGKEIKTNEQLSFDFESLTANKTEKKVS